MVRLSTKKRERILYNFKNRYARFNSYVNELYLYCRLARLSFREYRRDVRTGNEEWSRLPVEVPDKLLGEDKLRIKRIYKSRKRLSAILYRFAFRTTYEHGVVDLIASFEGFLQDILVDYVMEIPECISVITDRRDLSLPPEYVAEVRASSYYEIDDLLSVAYRAEINRVFKEAPEKYFKKLQELFGIKFEQDLVRQFLEINATRNMIVHNESRSNQHYYRAVSEGLQRTGGLDVRLPVNEEYFNGVVAVVKTLAKELRRSFLKKYSPHKKTDK